MTRITKIICDECGKELNTGEIPIHVHFYDFCSYECLWTWENHQEKLDEELSNLIGEKS